MPDDDEPKKRGPKTRPTNRFVGDDEEGAAWAKAFGSAVPEEKPAEPPKDN